MVPINCKIFPVFRNGVSAHKEFTGKKRRGRDRGWGAGDNSEKGKDLLEPGFELGCCTVNEVENNPLQLPKNVQLQAGLGAGKSSINQQGWQLLCARHNAPLKPFLLIIHLQITTTGVSLTGMLGVHRCQYCKVLTFYMTPYSDGRKLQWCLWLVIRMMKVV